MTVAWDDSSYGVSTDCDMDIEVTTTWSVATNGSTMTIALSMDCDYDAGNTLYAGVELEENSDGDGATYEVTYADYVRGTSANYTIAYTDCY